MRKIIKYLKVFYHFKSIKLKCYKYPSSGYFTAHVNIGIKKTCSGTFIEHHKYVMGAWLKMTKKIPSMVKLLSYYC